MTRCGLPCTTSATRTATGISTIAAFAGGLCPECWPEEIDEGAR
jgi:hypothetical protein